MATSSKNSASPPRPAGTRGTHIASYLLAASLCAATLIYGLLPGLLAVCLGYLLASALIGQQRKRGPHLSPTWSAAVVIVVPIIGLGVLFANAKGVAFSAVAQYQALLHHLAGTVLEIRQKLHLIWQAICPTSCSLPSHGWWSICNRKPTRSPVLALPGCGAGCWCMSASSWAP